MNAHLWAITGSAASGKKSVIRALTGVENEGYFDLMLATGQVLRMWTQTAPVNDGAEALNSGAWAKWWVDYSLEHGPHHRYNGLAGFTMFENPKPGYAAGAFLHAFAAAGGVIESIVTIGASTPDWARDLGVPCGTISSSMPANAIASMIRSMWGWR
jgi:hypothetical protein